MLTRMVTSSVKRAIGVAAVGIVLLQPAPAAAQIKAQVPPGSMTPPWDKGIQPISRESYWNAIECGKQKGDRPLCVFYDAELCKNDDFALTFFTPYKQVAYEVWQTVRRGGAAPTPDYGAAQRTRITLGITPVKGSKNAITALTINRDGKVVKPATQSLDEAGGRFIFDFTAFAPTSDLTIDMIGRAATRTCDVPQTVLKTFR
jgi:hypothetical protein